MDVFQSRQFCVVELDDGLVLVYPGGVDRLGEDRASARNWDNFVSLPGLIGGKYFWPFGLKLTVVAQQNIAGADFVLLGELLDAVFLEHGAASAAEGAVGSDVDTLGLAEVHNFLLRQIRVVLDLVGRRSDLSLLEKSLQEGNREVGNANGLCLARLWQLLELLPGLDEVPRLVQVTGTVRKLGDGGVVACKTVSPRASPGVCQAAYPWGSWEQASLEQLISLSHRKPSARESLRIRYRSM